MTLLADRRLSSADVPSAVLPTLRAALQPLVALDGRVFGHEGLLRGDEPPEDLFRRAMSEGWAEALDRRAATLVMKAAATWSARDEQVFVNAPAMPVSQFAAWLSFAIEAARAAGLDACRLVVELNENQTGCDLGELAGHLARARRLGIRFALDDVDGGPRCRRFVEVLRPDFVKLDGAVVHALSEPSVQERVRNLALLCADVGAVLVAEKVETEAQVDALVDLGLNLFQGWLTGMPVSGSRPSTAGWCRPPELQVS